jgi:membrane associated rhomboid family serine protease
VEADADRARQGRASNQEQNARMRSTSYQRVGFGGYHLTPWVQRLLIINAAAFLLTMVVGRGAIFDLFAFQPSNVLTRPWGIVSYMFLHYDFWHLFLNMLVLFFFGPPLEDRWGSREFIRYYMLCGLGGAALSFLFASYSIVGASAAVYGLMLAFAMNWPNMPIYIWGIFPVKAKWLVAFLFLASVFSAFGTDGGGVAHFAHLGGLVAGFIYLKTDWRFASGKKRVKRGITSIRLNVIPRDEGPREKAAVARRAEQEKGRTRWSRRDEDDALLDEVDRVLDKISATGMSSLSPEELKLLDEVSRRRRSN